jgi:hypothetical protein
MVKQVLTLIAVISGCSLAPPPAIPDPISETAALRPSSVEWAALYAEEDRRIDAEIVICRGCFQKSMITPDRWPVRHGTEQKQLAKKKP